MEPNSITTEASVWQRWFVQRETEWRRTVLIVGIVVFLIPWAQVWIAPRGDFHLHYELARRLAADELIYANGHDIPYPPFWAVAHLPCLWVSDHVAQILLYPLFLIGYVLLLRSLCDVCHSWRSATQNTTTKNTGAASSSLFWVGVLATFLASRFLIRDMKECGVNLFLVAGAWEAFVLWRKGHDKTAGFILGGLTALKCTPALFIAYFFWKRQWNVVGSACVAILVCMLVPLVWMGPELYVETMHYWFNTLTSGMATADPSKGVLAEEPLQNMSLKPAVGRFLMHLPAEHVARMDHPLYVDFLNLPPAWAGKIAWGVMGLLLVVILRFVPQKVESRFSDKLPWEFALGNLLILLYSPITWGQHCVGLLPAFFLIGCVLFCPPKQVQNKLPIWGALALYSLVNLVLNRGLIGKDLTWIIDCYRLPTFTILLFVPLLLWLRNKTSQQEESVPEAINKA